MPLLTEAGTSSMLLLVVENVNAKFRENWSIGGSKLGRERNTDTRTDGMILRALLGACENGLLAAIFLFVRPAEWVVLHLVSHQRMH